MLGLADRTTHGLAGQSRSPHCHHTTRVGCRVQRGDFCARLTLMVSGDDCAVPGARTFDGRACEEGVRVCSWFALLYDLLTHTWPYNVRTYNGMIDDGCSSLCLLWAYIQVLAAKLMVSGRCVRQTVLIGAYTPLSAS